MSKPLSGLAFLISLLTSSAAFAQYATDALRYSEINQTGSARFQALGGNHASIGGDPSSIFGNPAGLGFYTRSEFSLSPAVSLANTKADYLGTTTKSMSDNKSLFNIPQASVVFASQPGFQRKWKRSAFGVSFSRQQSFQNGYNYGGRNNNSAYIDNVIEGVNNAKTSVSDLEKDFDSGAAGGAVAYSLPAAYYQMYLINPTTSAGPPYRAVDANSVVDQTGSFTSKGAVSQWTFAYAGNLNDKFYLGGNVGFSRIRYEYSSTFSDDYIDSPELTYIDQFEDFTVRGSGFNFSLGAIYKFNPMFQVGGTVISPTFSAIKETFSQRVSAGYIDGKVTGPDGNLITPPYTTVPIAPNDFEYSLIGPLRGNVGATVLFQNKGFLTATIEYVGYSGMRVRTSYLSSAGNQDFKDNTKADIQDSFRNAVNFRLGGEFRANIFRARLGGAYISDPYLSQTDGIDRSKILASAGVGVRTDRFFVDLTGTFTTYKSAYTPYYLNNVNDYASVAIKNKPVNVMVTGGVFF
ncbi:hemin receptor [Dyadobacter beijingensis]|uniref:Hemin receptor n=1 Tax=Dyadobacter beijingensis TaxID=365489 RepID=A0ABQ2HR11_9BACT|nr:TonB-dependent receptor [Dyadobacter beijingensis]GGM87465.1 hemin receptor [Dyadobacter beijingensis]